MRTPARWFYLSFADDERGGFLGGIYIEANGPLTASRRAHMLSINPGGQVLTVEMPSGYPLPPPEYRERLLTKAEIQALDDAVSALH